MKYLPVVLISMALAVTACTGTATVSGSGVGSATTEVHPNAAPNADENLSDLGNRPNPPVHKVPGQPPLAPPVVTPNHAAQPAPVQLRDRCSNETGRPGKPQPMCLPA